MGRAAGRPPRPARPPVAALGRRCSATRSTASAAIDLGPLDAARRRACASSSAGSPVSVATPARGPARSTCCGSRSTSSSGPALDDPTRTSALDARRDALADAVGHRLAAEQAVAVADRAKAAPLDSLAAALAALDGRAPFADRRSSGSARLAAELADVAADLASVGEQHRGGSRAPGAAARLAASCWSTCGASTAPPSRRRARHGTLADVLAYATRPRERLATCSSHDEQRGRARARARPRPAPPSAMRPQPVGAARRTAAPRLAARGAGPPPRAGDAQARDGDRASATTIRATTCGSSWPPTPGRRRCPLAKVASGGELARAMLALRLVLTAAPPILVFDEVDAGIGGASGARGRAGPRRPGRRPPGPGGHPPAAGGGVRRRTGRGDARCSGGCTTVARAATLGAEERVVELSRMLSGTPESARAREHASELLGRRVAGPGPVMARRVDRDVDALTGSRPRRPTHQGPRRSGSAPGEIAVIDHEDLDRVAAETLDRGERRCDRQRRGVHLRPLPEHGSAAGGRGRHPAARQRRLRGPRRGGRRDARHRRRRRDARRRRDDRDRARVRAIASLEATLDEAPPDAWATSSSGSPRTRSTTSRRRATSSSTTRTSPTSPSTSRAATC